MKMIVSDFDGTLIDNDLSIPLSTVLEIDKFRTNGNVFTIATGRVLNSVLDYNRDVTFVDYIIACNGAYVYDCNKEKIVFKKNISITTIKKVIKNYINNGIYFCASNDWFLLDGKNTNENDSELIIDNIEDFFIENKSNIYKLEIYFKNKKERDIEYDNIVNSKFNIGINKQCYDNDKYLLEITNKDINKLVGIEKVCNKINISLDDVIAIGDSYNDIKMVESVGVGISVSNAVKELKKVSNKKTSSNNDKGVEKVIKKLNKCEKL